jgi:hypothetical protein
MRVQPGSSMTSSGGFEVSSVPESHILHDVQQAQNVRVMGEERHKRAAGVYDGPLVAAGLVLASKSRSQICAVCSAIFFFLAVSAATRPPRYANATPTTNIARSSTKGRLRSISDIRPAIQPKGEVKTRTTV